MWKLLAGSVLPGNRVLFLTDRNSLKDQAYRAFSAFDAHERVMLDKDIVARGEHRVGKIYFANYRNLDEELDDRKLFEHFESDFFGLVVVDECHRSGFGDWFGVLEHFGNAYQLGLTATPREVASNRRLTDEENRRDTFEYFGDPAYTYSLKQAIEDGYLVPYLLDERITNLDEQGYVGLDGKRYTTSNFERDIRPPDRLPRHSRPSAATHARARAEPIRAGPHDRGDQQPVPEAREGPDRRLRACVRSPA